MATITDIKLGPAQDTPDEAETLSAKRRHEAVTDLQAGFCEFHKARAILTDPSVEDDETNDAAMKRMDAAIGHIIAHRAAVDWQVWAKITLLDFLLTEEGGGMENVDYPAIRLLGSIKADLTHLGIGDGEARQ